MKKLLIVGNWKSNKTNAEAADWLKNFPKPPMPIVLCVPFTDLSVFKWAIGQQQLPITLGAQDISPFGEGAYTGEISGKQIKELADWVIIGHSERRKHFGETDATLLSKVKQAKEAGISIIYCVQDASIAIPGGVDVVAYEPYAAIGSGNPDSPENANRVITQIKAKTHVAQVIYGGSVTSDNVALFVRQPAIDGVLPGGASLDPTKFANLITAAAST